MYSRQEGWINVKFKKMQKIAKNLKDMWYNIISQFLSYRCVYLW